MNLNELLQELDLESAEEFQYFENLADLIETKLDVASDVYAELVTGIDSAALKELFDNYFDDLLSYVQEDNRDFYVLLQSIGLQLSNLAYASDDEENASILGEEIGRFKEWYMDEENVVATNVATTKSEGISVAEAITRSKLEHLSDDRWEFDFEEAINDYELDEYIMPVIPELDEDVLAEDDYDDHDDY